MKSVWATWATWATWAAWATWAIWTTWAAWATIKAKDNTTLGQLKECYDVKSQPRHDNI